MQWVNNLSVRHETQGPSLGCEDPLEKRIATHSSTFAWRIPWTKEPGGLQSMGLQRVRHDWRDWAWCTHQKCRIHDCGKQTVRFYQTHSIPLSTQVTVSTLDTTHAHHMHSDGQGWMAIHDPGALPTITNANKAWKSTRWVCMSAMDSHTFCFTAMKFQCSINRGCGQLGLSATHRGKLLAKSDCSITRFRLH